MEFNAASSNQATAPDSEAVTEIGEDITADLDSFASHLADAPKIESEVVIGSLDSPWEQPWRMVYAVRRT